MACSGSAERRADVSATVSATSSRRSQDGRRGAGAASDRARRIRCRRRWQEQQARSRNNDRQKRLVADTDKLLALATELKQDVDKTNKDVMSVDVIKKADEIEKLAHSVKERMKG